MPDLVNYSVVRLASASVVIPRWQILGQIVDSQTQQTVIADISADNAIFPNVLSKLTAAQQDEWVAGVVQALIFKRFNL